MLRKEQQKMFQHRRIADSFITTLVVVGVLPVFMWFMFDGNDFAFYVLLPYHFSAVIGLLLGIAFGYVVLRRIKKLRFITQLVSTLSLVYLASKLGLDEHYLMNIHALYTAFIVTSSLSEDHA